MKKIYYIDVNTDFTELVENLDKFLLNKGIVEIGLKSLSQDLSFIKWEDGNYINDISTHDIREFINSSKNYKIIDSGKGKKERFKIILI